MLKFVACSRVLKHVVTGSRSNAMPALCPASSVTSDQFINTKSFRLYSSNADKQNHVPGWFYQLSLFRTLRRLSKRIIYQSNVQKISPYRKKEDDDSLYVTIPMNGLKPETLKVSVDHATVFIQGEFNRGFGCDVERQKMKMIGKYICWVDMPDIDSPDKIFKTSDIKAEYIRYDGLLTLTVPKLQKKDLVYNVNFKTIHDYDDDKNS